MTYLYKVNFALLLITIALMGCEKKEWQHNAVERVPVFAISNFDITTSGVSNTEKAPEKIDIYTEQQLHISQVGSFLTKQDLEASKVTYEGDNVMIEYKAIGEFYYTLIDETNGNVSKDTIVNPFYSYVITDLMVKEP